VPIGRQELYVSAVDFILVKRTVTVAAGSTTEVSIALTEGTGTYTETVNVRGTAGTGNIARREPAVASEQTLGGRALQQLRGILTNDPLRAVQVLPAVAAGDDFRSEFAIRGAGVPQMNFTFEGIAWRSHDGIDYASELSAGRNTLRVAPYSRLDARANRTFTWDQKRLTLFLEAINVYNRTNLRAALPSVNRRTFEATGLFERMVPRIPSVGILFEFR